MHTFLECNRNREPEVQIMKTEWMERMWQILLTVKLPLSSLLRTMSACWPNAQCPDTLPFLAARHREQWGGAGGAQPAGQPPCPTRDQTSLHQIYIKGQDQKIRWISSHIYLPKHSCESRRKQKTFSAQNGCHSTSNTSVFWFVRRHPEALTQSQPAFI